LLSLNVSRQQRRFQFQKRGQQFIRLDDVTPPVSPIAVNGPASAIFRDRAAIAPGPSGSSELVGDNLPIFHWRHHARWSYSCATPMRTIQVRPSRNPRWQKQNGWEVNEGDGVCPVYCGATARESALSYARQRAGYSPTEIQVLDARVERWGDYSSRGQTQSSENRRDRPR
jgi:hypothetical protein